jgi:type II secretory pathway component PulJ
MRKILRSRAFSILEIMVYLTLSLILSLGLFKLFSYIHKQSVCSETLYSKNIKDNMAFDILRRDLFGASPRADDWDVSVGVVPRYNFSQRLETTRDEKFVMIFKKYRISKNDTQKSSSIGWKVVKKNLYRFEGQYDFIKKKWSKKSKSLVCKDVERAGWTLQKDKSGQKIVGVTATLEFARGVKHEMFFATRSYYALCATKDKSRLI